MAVKAKAALVKTLHKQAKPKRTRQGQGINSKPRGTRKLSRGQG